MKKLYVAATRQNDGKTMTSLGLFHAIQKRLENVAYIKPVGQQYKLINGEKIDKDAILFHKAFNLTDTLKDMSPIAVPKGFTEEYINAPNKDYLQGKITDALDRLQEGKEFILCEGTGHAGVGSVFDLSNAEVAKLMGAKVIIVSIGGIGKAIDELMLNCALFREKGVEVVGVIINKVLPEKYDKIVPIVERGLARFNIPLLGAVPLNQKLTYPTIAALVDELSLEVLSGEKGMLNTVEKFIIGDMQPHNALDMYRKNSLLIVPGNREGLILTTLVENMLRTQNDSQISGIIFTGGSKPHDKILDLLGKTTIPLMVNDEDAFTIATKINKVIFKIREDEAQKISIAAKIIEQYVDIDKLVKSL